MADTSFLMAVCSFPMRLLGFLSTSAARSHIKEGLQLIRHLCSICPSVFPIVLARFTQDHATF